MDAPEPHCFSLQASYGNTEHEVEDTMRTVRGAYNGKLCLYVYKVENGEALDLEMALNMDSGSGSGGEEARGKP